ncbi:hypothetical protein [Arthrobacter woluwensis]|uniref:hypothetical protein n=1 Tax=Arthrobacter woluwensis TaxID=156980 RepID=UPI001AAE1CCA|nr:hypothetical protein [Arthrobacter woluwensis]QTF70593.1 hypothetical protein G8758_00130 [Arthrobacter woluwensis]
MIQIQPGQLRRGDRVRTQNGNSRTWWAVQVAGPRFVIMTKAQEFAPTGSDPYYTIVDFEKGVRGPCNLIGQGWDMTSRGPYVGSRLLHVHLLDGELAVSHRNNVPLDFIELRSQHQEGPKQ